jgi:hypothetical protein
MNGFEGIALYKVELNGKSGLISKTGKMAHPFFNSVPEGAKRWNELVTEFMSKEVFNKASGNERQAIQKLIDYVYYEDFDKNKRIPLLKEGLANYFIFHPDGGEEYIKLNEFSISCVNYLFTDREVFEEFQKQLGGKKERQEEQQRQEEQERQEQQQRQEEQKRREQQQRQEERERQEQQ